MVRDKHYKSNERSIVLASPHDSRGGTGRVEAGVGLVAFVRLAELPVNAGAEFCWVSVHVTNVIPTTSAIGNHKTL
jgi:hypothetical protein